MKARLIRVDKLNDQVSSFWFRPERRFSYIAGQFIEMSLPHKPADDRGTRRWFTLSSSPTEELLSITTRFSHQGSSFKHALGQLKAGDDVEISEPMGDFVLPKNTLTPILFVAGGMGITPFRSIAKWLSDTSEKRQISMIYALKSAEDSVFQEIFKSAAIEPELFISETSRNHQHLDVSTILSHLPKNSQKHLIYVSGPEPMVEELDKQLKATGYPANQIVGDFFPGYLPI